MVKMLQAVIFDLDGVITDTAEYHYLAWKMLAEELKIPFSREFNEKLKGISRLDSLEQILIHGGKNCDFAASEKANLANKKNAHYCKLIQRLTPADILPGIQVLLLEIKEQGLKIGLASVSKNAFTVIDALKLKGQFDVIVDARRIKLTPADILPGIQVLLLEIKEQGLKIGLASVSKNAFTVIDALKLKGQFDVIVDARRIKNSKPNPEIFLTAAELLQVEAAACIGIEDAAAGVEAIKGAGMFAIGIGSQENLAQADRVFKTTGELSMNVIVENYEQA